MLFGALLQDFNHLASRGFSVHLDLTKVIQGEEDLSERKKNIHPSSVSIDIPIKNLNWFTIELKK